ncbi:MAG: GAK system XXXCH domain-containing protein [Desulfovibrionaceae bacterium]
MNFTKLKQDLQTLFNTLREKALLGEAPTEEECTQFVRLLKLMQRDAATEWADECDDFVHMAGELHVSVRKGNIPESVRLIEALSEAKAYCHRTFKD